MGLMFVGWIVAALPAVQLTMADEALDIVRRSRGGFEEEAGKGQLRLPLVNWFPPSITNMVVLTSSGRGLSWGHAWVVGAFFLLLEARLLGRRCGANDSNRATYVSIEAGWAAAVLGAIFLCIDVFSVVIVKACSVPEKLRCDNKVRRRRRQQQLCQSGKRKVDQNNQKMLTILMYFSTRVRAQQWALIDGGVVGGGSWLLWLMFGVFGLSLSANPIQTFALGPWQPLT